ncbi:MAG: hypothetical protein P4L43_08400 [Syntrophobacteraceae bacterium]|nr:hypothetical protein [Syntrophobacteraceae bacterium]
MKKELSEDILGCCACEDNTEETFSGLTCADKKRIFTIREQEVLARIREASLRAGVLRKEINGQEGHGRQGARLELENLRLMRAELEKERVAARDERMRMLGHL